MLHTGDLFLRYSNNMNKRRDLTIEEANAAKILNELWLKQKTATGISLEGAADKMNYANGSSVRAYLKGFIPLNASALIKFSTLLNRPPFEIFPEMALALGLSKDIITNTSSVDELVGKINLDAADFAVLGILEYKKSFPLTMDDEEWRKKAFKALYRAWFNEEMRSLGVIPLLNLVA